MTQEGFKRKLAAIFSADAVGYSRLMADDEAATVKAITVYREIMASLIKQHRGRVVDSPGDNVLAEFSSVVDAVQCAVAVQKEIKARNNEFPENRRMQFRIGINLGDVIQEGERIYGDGVNIAARLEGLAEPGGICISGNVFDQVEKKLAFEYDYIGEQTFKNISKAVKVYRTLVMADDNSPEFGVKHEVADKPSIAVLPFINMSGDPTQEYFCDGLTDHIITGISKYPNLIVIARNSTFTYKGRMVKVQQIGQDLGVRYVLEGSVQRSGERVRITSQLIEAKTGHHLWADNFDRNSIDIFDLQDDIAIEILRALRIKLTEGEQARHYARGGTRSLKALELVFQAREYLYKMTKDDNAQAKQSLDEAISIDPHFANAYTELAGCHILDFIFSWSKSPIESLSISEQIAQKAFELDDTSSARYHTFGLINLCKRQYSEAIDNFEKAVLMNPNGAHDHLFLGFALTLSDSIDEGIMHLEKAMRINPIPPTHYWTIIGGAYSLAGKYEKSITCYKKAIQSNPDDLQANLGLTAAYSRAGLDKDARKTAQNVLRIDPGFSLKNYSRSRTLLMIKNKSYRERSLEALRKAGIPE